MERVVPWTDLAALVSPYMAEGRRGRPLVPVEAMLRIHFMQQLFNLSDPAMEDTVHDVPLFRDFAGLGGWDDRLPDESTILRIRHMLVKHKLAPETLKSVNDLLQHKGLLLKTGKLVDATLVATPSSTKNATGERDPEMKRSKKGNPWFFGMQAHIGADAESGLVHTVRGTAGSVNDVVEAPSPSYGHETEAWGDAGCQGADKRANDNPEVCWDMAMRPGKRRQVDHSKPVEQITDRLERLNASIRAKVEHPFRVNKRQLGHVKVRFRGAGEEHGAVAHADRTGQSVDGAQTTGRSRGMRAAEMALPGGSTGRRHLGIARQARTRTALARHRSNCKALP